MSFYGIYTLKSLSIMFKRRFSPTTLLDFLAGALCTCILFGPIGYSTVLWRGNIDDDNLQEGQRLLPQWAQLTLQSQSVQSFDKLTEMMQSPMSNAVALTTPDTKTFRCHWIFVKYYPSEYEQYWTANITSLQKSVCLESNTQSSEVEGWMAHAEAT